MNSRADFFSFLLSPRPLTSRFTLYLHFIIHFHQVHAYKMAILLSIKSLHVILLSVPTSFGPLTQMTFGIIFKHRLSPIKVDLTITRLGSRCICLQCLWKEHCPTTGSHNQNLVRRFTRYCHMTVLSDCCSPC